jgi:IclR family pca regulon transcriptional regulator
MTANQYTVETLLRGLDILILFTRETPSLTLTEITHRTGLNKATVFRFVATLEQAGYLVRDPETKRYTPGLKVLQLGFAAISSLELRQVARPFLEELSQRVGETVSLSILDGTEIIYVDRVRNRQIVGVVLGLGSRLPAHCTSMGKAMLANLEHVELEDRLGQAALRPCTPKSLVDSGTLNSELEKIRQQGYAINDEELEIGLRAVAAPIWDSSNKVCGAINVTGSAAMISSKRLIHDLAPEVMKTASGISLALGYTPRSH